MNTMERGRIGNTNAILSPCGRECTPRNGVPGLASRRLRWDKRSNESYLTDGMSIFPTTGLTFPIYLFGLCSCDCLFHPL